MAHPGMHARRAFAVSPNDSLNLAYQSRGLYVGGAGDVSIEMEGGTIVTFSAVPAGTILPIAAIRVRSTNTTATGIVALY